MIWTKTDAGRLEMQARALVKDRARRNLLLVIDGLKSEEMLLAGLAGVSPDDFRSLEALGLIVPLNTSRRTASSTGGERATAASNAAVDSTSMLPEEVANPLDYSQFTAALTKLISNHLGLRGFVLTLAVERAGTIEELQAVAQRTIDQIRDRRGEATADAARQTLYGA
ncbi:MAG: hypothetical protein ABIV63_09085 [Caldimonas sp.]